MPSQVPAQLLTMREITGTHWAPGEGPNKTIGSWLRFISSEYPDMASYCHSVIHEEYFEWCGLTVAYCMAKAGVRPVFGSDDTGKFLWSLAWKGWGEVVQTPEPGDVIILGFGGGSHHVTLFESDAGTGNWSCRGGNQANDVNVMQFPRSSVLGVRRPGPAPLILEVSETLTSVVEFAPT